MSVDLQEALVVIFTPVIYGLCATIFAGSILAAITNAVLDAVGLLTKSHERR